MEPVGAQRDQRTETAPALQMYGDQAALVADMIRVHPPLARRLLFAPTHAAVTRQLLHVFFVDEFENSESL